VVADAYDQCVVGMLRSVGGSASKGGVRLDAILFDEAGKPLAIFDLKTGKAGLTPERINQIRSHLPEEFKDVPILEVRPSTTKK